MTFKKTLALTLENGKWINLRGHELLTPDEAFEEVGKLIEQGYKLDTYRQRKRFQRYIKKASDGGYDFVIFERLIERG